MRLLNPRRFVKKQWFLASCTFDPQTFPFPHALHSRLKSTIHKLKNRPTPLTTIPTITTPVSPINNDIGNNLSRPPYTTKTMAPNHQQNHQQYRDGPRLSCISPTPSLQWSCRNNLNTCDPQKICLFIGLLDLQT